MRKVVHTYKQGSIWEFSVLSTWFFYEPKTAIKINYTLKKEKEKKKQTEMTKLKFKEVTHIKKIPRKKTLA